MKFLYALFLLLIIGCVCPPGIPITPDKPCVNGTVVCEDDKTVMYENCEN